MTTEAAKLRDALRAAVSALEATGYPEAICEFDPRPDGGCKGPAYAMCVPCQCRAAMQLAEEQEND